eukprot:COSAG06_NODE_1083_length_10780_cov_2.547608_10_plen_54_part_00
MEMRCDGRKGVKMVLLVVIQTGAARCFVPSSCLTATFGSRPFTVGIESLIAPI